MDQKNITKFLNYDGNYAMKWLMEAVYFTISANKNDPIVYKIFNLSDINVSVDDFLDETKKKIDKNKHIDYTKKRSPSELTDSIVTWLYYSIYWVYEIKDIDTKSSRKDQSILHMALKLHYYYLKYITMVDEKSRINKKSVEYAVGTVVRAIEILTKISQKKSAYLTEKYFPEAIDDIFVNFIDTIKNDYVEKECLFIKKDPDRKGEIFIKYDNPHIGIAFQLLPSRRLSKGYSKESEGNQDVENHNIIDYLLQGYLDVQKIVNLEKGKSARSNSSKLIGRCLDQVTQNEKLLMQSIDKVQNDNEETIEDGIYKDLKVRAALQEDVKVIPDQYKQRMINRSFSASIARQNKILNSAYDVPPFENLSVVIKHLASSRLDLEFTNKNLYLSVFILSIVLGRDYLEILELLIKEKSNECLIAVNKKLITVKLDHKLFGSSLKKFSVKNGKNISFNLPTGVVALYEYMRRQLLSLPEGSQEDLYNNEKQYIKFIEELMESCPNHVNFDLKNTWKILVVYSKNSFENNIASLCCIGKYITLDKSAMSYTSTHKSGQIHSNFINDIHNNLGIRKCINHLLWIDETEVKENYLFDKKMEYVGSNRLVKNEEIKKYFSYMRRAIQLEDDQIKYFNLYAIYARYALSLLLATRYGKASSNLKDISFELNLIRIIEKSDDRQSGVRFIPLCKQANKIIRKYKSLCSALGFKGDNIYFLDGNKRHILYGENKKTLVKIFNEDYSIDQSILDFIQYVPLNFGRHIAVKVAGEMNLNLYYMQAMMGHYSKGAEQFGYVSTTNSQDYILKVSGFFAKVGRVYGI